MHHSHSHRPSVDDLALRAVRLGRDLAPALRPHCRAVDLPQAGAALRRLDAGDVFDVRDLVVFEALEAALHDEIVRETLGSRLEFVFLTDGEGQEDPWIARVPERTHRGDELAKIQRNLGELIGLRRQVEDRIRASGAVASLSRR